MGTCPTPLGCQSSLPCEVPPQRPCCPATWCHGCSWATLGPTASPQCPVLCLLPGPMLWGGCGGMRSRCPLGKSTAPVDSNTHPPTKQEELTTLATHGHLCKYLSSLSHPSSVQKHDKAGKGSRHRHNGGSDTVPDTRRRGGIRPKTPTSSREGGDRCWRGSGMSARMWGRGLGSGSRRSCARSSWEQTLAVTDAGPSAELSPPPPSAGCSPQNPARYPGEL